MAPRTIDGEKMMPLGLLSLPFSLTTNRAIIRQHVPKVVFHVLNWTFISFIQSILLFMIAAPVYSTLLATQFEPNVTTADLGFVAVELGLILTEWFADQQQWGKFLSLTGFRVGK